jgi:putative DNA primase/helicase
MIDFQAIAQQSLAHAETLLLRWLPAGRRNGHEWLVGDLSGNAGESTSINMRTGAWADFAGDKKGGDFISLLAAIRGCTQLEAAKQIADELGIRVDHPPAAPPKSKKQQWTQVVPAPEHVAPPTMYHFNYKEPVAKWCYKDAEGRVIGWIGRFTKSDGGKEVMPMTWGRNIETQEEKWCWLSFPKPRPLYGLPLLKAKPDARVIIVEGEKCADALRERGLLVITWPGGGKAVHHADWTPLAGRKVTIWPDRDRKTYGEKETKDATLVGTEKPWNKQPGYKAMMDIAEVLGPLGCEIRLITPPEGKPDGWDCADAIADGWTNDQIAELFKAAVPFAVEPPPSEEPGPTAPMGLDEPAEPETEWPFRILGHDMGTFYYLSHASRQVVELNSRGHNKIDLLQLAPLDWWMRMFPGKDEDASVNWMFAANSLIQQSLRRVFDPADIRGRGSWLDNGTVVYHAGDCLMVRNMPHALSSWQSEFVYQRAKRIKVEPVPPAGARDAARLIELTRCLNLKNPIDHLLLAGWLVCAPICGVLDWRPHIWITGPSGSGKTWLIERIIRPLLGNMALYVQSNTTEAGIRQSLGCDALPVMFDEAETENQRDLQRFQQILILARQASRDSGGRIVKGTAGGQAQAFHIRSSFCFSSIGVAATQRADLSRITALELFKRHGDDAAAQWDVLLAHWEATAANPDWCASIRNRAIELAETIAANAHTFATACTRHLGAQRDGDQIGALLAGAFALTSARQITPEQAADWCAKQDWSTFAQNESDMDERQCLATLLSGLIEHEDDGRRVRRSIGELLTLALNFREPDHKLKLARETLERHGIGIRREGIDVSNSHSELKRIFADTTFAGKWADQLKRLEGAKTIAASHFNRAQTRAVRLPMSMFEDTLPM